MIKFQQMIIVDTDLFYYLTRKVLSHGYNCI